MKFIKGSSGKHQTLVNLIHNLYTNVGIYTEKNVLYDRGELDIYVPRQTINITDDWYIEVKCNIGNEDKARQQIQRAKKFKQCTKGFMATYQGAYWL